MNSNRFGGERLESKNKLAQNNLLEHLARYALVPGDPGQVVLDIGCGAGHGSAALSQTFKKVYGVDIDAAAIGYAKSNWQERNIEFSVGSGTNIEFPDNTFDVVTAFEVFEHICDWSKFLSEIRRVTTPGGKIYISTPNKSMYSPGTKRPINPHHCFEMTIAEFTEAMQKYFVLTELYGQRTPIYNDHWIWPILNPILFAGKKFIPYKWNNTLKLMVVNWIKPELEPTDIVFRQDAEWIERSRFMLAVCENKAK